ncbi:MAG: metalloregulator ArsR/SmtB family transcription factor [Pseudomonadota bacterium]
MTLRTADREMRTASPRTAAEIAALAKALGHPARMQIVLALMRRNSCIGCDLADETGRAASTTSEHLRILKAAGIISGEIERPRVCYSLNPEALLPLKALLDDIASRVAPQIRRSKTRSG